ncbi:MAG: AAA family ATPase, partial [Pirellulaceae bacterium]|nr:AAA family ATPase [Pirellulaceae bacterium]
MEQILGQQRAVEALQSALQSGRLHHAFVFHGPKGVGKFTTARAFAGVLLCPNATRDRAGLIYACGSCRACALMQDGAHPDDHVVTKELASYSCNEKVRVSKHLTLSIDVLSENLIGPVHLAPRLGYRKVFIVNEAELITQTSQNLLLKILEEPPPGTFIILVTDNQDQLLPTIRSRCQLVSFVPLPPPLISDWI